MSKLSYYQTKGEPTPLERVESGKARKKVLETVRTIEMQYGTVLHSHGASSEPFHLFYQESQFRPAPLPEGTF
jgi:hypothetical protein